MPKAPSSAPQAEHKAKPLKRPHQQRAKATVQAIYDAFVLIWRAEGWEAATTRAIALEAGVAVGTLYDYFPNKEAILSGYIRFCIEGLIQQIDEVGGSAEPWPVKVHRLVHLVTHMGQEQGYYFDAEMLEHEGKVAERRHHRKVFDELLAAWQHVIQRCDDLPARPPASRIHALLLAAWGGRRYLLLIQADADEQQRYADELAAMGVARLLGGGSSLEAR